MIEKFTAWIGKRRTPPATGPAERPIHVERRRSAEHLRTNVHSIKAERRQSTPILRKRSTKHVVTKEPKDVQRARKAKAYAAAALNSFPIHRRLEMLEMAAQLINFSAAVEPTWVEVSDDAGGPRFTCFKLRINENGEIVVEEKIQPRLDTVAIELEPAHVFSDDQTKLGKAQLHAAFLWQSAKDSGFHEAPPDFKPLHLAATLSED